MKCYCCGYAMEDDSLKCKNCGFVHPGYTENTPKYKTMLVQMGEEYRKKNHISLWRDSSESQSHEDSYDVFICYKEMDDQGIRTQDSIIANDIYEFLILEGFGVFFESSTMPGENKEEVFNALNSARVMLCIGTDPDYFNSIDMKWKWSFYLNRMLKESNIILIPCYNDMKPEKLPKEFANLPAQDISRVSFLHNITCEIKKLIVNQGRQIPEKTDEFNGEIPQTEDSVDKKENPKNEERQPKITPKPENKENKRKSHKVLPVAIVALSVAIVALSLLVTQVVVPNNRYNAAAALKEAGRYEEAMQAFEALNGYKDSADQIAECENGIEKIKKKDAEYEAAIELENAGKYEEAMQAFETLDGYKDSAEQIVQCEASKNEIEETKKKDAEYEAAIELEKAGQYKEAMQAFELLNGYKDSVNQIERCKTALYENLEVGSAMYFGSYEQDGDTSNGKEDIEWIVLDKEDDCALLISKYALDCKPYHHESYYEVSWENTSLCKWLNAGFMNNAFSVQEKAQIGQVFLLSTEEAEKYFSSNEERKCIPTEYANTQGAITNGPNREGGKGTCWWWLRCDYDSARVYYDGSLHYGGRYIYTSNYCVRPALWINF